MTVSIIKDWDGDMNKQTPGGTGFWDGIRFINGHSAFADVVVVLNSSPQNFIGFYRKGGKWMMSQEPPHESYIWQTKAYTFFDKVFTFWDPKKFPQHPIVNTQTCLPWHVKKSFDELIALKASHLKKRNHVSWITSNLNIRPGHELRLSFMDFLNQNGFKFDLFGRGFQPIDDKFDAIAPYNYSIAIENFSCPDYWTEKIADCFLSWTMPVYYGCTNITDYFPKESMILIDPNKPDDAIKKMKDALSQDLWNERLSYIHEARQLILNKYQFFPAIVEKIKNLNISKQNRTIAFFRKSVYK